MKFQPIDLKSWPRGQMFYYFSQMAPTGYSITTNMDVTSFYHAVKNGGYRFFPAYVWIVTRNLNRHMEFKIAKQEDTLGYYDQLTPMYASFHEDDKTFSFMWTEFQERFQDFHALYLDNQLKYGSNHGVLAQPETPPPANAYTVSCIPWVKFSHFAVHSYDNKPYYFPSIESGKLSQENGRIYMPLSMTCHHATTDGYHSNCFLSELQKDMDEFIKII